MTWFELINRINRHLRIPYSFWKIRNNWYVFRDGPFSLTPLIVYKEIESGLYNINLLPGETVLDIGAHIGMFTIPKAKQNPSTRFICYEPNPKNYLNLLHNLKINKITNVEAICAGLAPQPCLLDFTHYKWNTGGSTSSINSKGKIPAYPLSLILKRHNLKFVEVVKIDCEGGEFNGSISSSDIERIEYLIMEIHGHLGNAKSVLDLGMKAHSYTIKVIQSKDIINGIYAK